MSLLQLISASPFKSLTAHMQIIDACMSTCFTLFEAAERQDIEAMQRHHAHICHKEREADDIKRALREQLHRDLLLPVSRHEILKMMTLQDDLANLTKDISGLMVERHLSVPEVLHADWRALQEDVKRCHGILNQTHALLSRLVKQVFNASVADEMNALLSDLDDCERASDDAQHQLRSALFTIEKSLHPIDAISLYTLFRFTGMLADRCQSIGNHMLYMIAH